MTKKNSCVALFGTYSEVNSAVKELEKAGFDMNEVAVVSRESLRDTPVTGGLPALVMALSGLGIPADSIKKYGIALRDQQQWLVLVHGSTEEVERGADTLATGREIEVAVHQSVWFVP